MLSRLVGHSARIPATFTAILRSRNAHLKRNIRKSSSSLSYAHGTSTTPLIGETIGSFFEKQVAIYGDKEALVVKHQSVRWSYTELNERADCLARGLLGIGVNRGDRVGIWSPNNSEWLLTQLATAKIGAVLVNINPAYRSDELQHALNLVDVSTLVMAPSLKTSNFLDIIHELAPEIAHCKPGDLSSATLPSLKTVVRLGTDITPGMFNFGDIISFGFDNPALVRELKQRSSALQSDDAINIQFTSGTTGRPKGATLTHHNILNNGFFVGEGISLSPQDKLCIPVPLYHCMGMVMGNLGALSHGSTLVYSSEVFDSLEVLKAITEEGCTVAYGVPTMFLSLLDHKQLASYDVKKTLVKGIMAGSLCPPSVMERCQKVLGMSDITICYGMTETSPVSLATFATSDPIKRVSTVGAAIPHVEVKIIDTDEELPPGDRKTVPRGHIGEVCTRGYSVMLGYWNDDAKTADTIDEKGWLHTGKLFKYIYIPQYCFDNDSVKIHQTLRMLLLIDTNTSSISSTATVSTIISQPIQIQTDESPQLTCSVCLLESLTHSYS